MDHVNPRPYHGLKPCPFTDLGRPSRVPLQVFSKAGLLGVLEELRDERLAKVLTLLQAASRRRVMMTELLRMMEKR